MTPNGKAHLFSTFLEPTGTKTMSFSSQTARDTAFASGSMGRITDLGSNFDYIRKDNVLKVPYNAAYLDELGVNYCRYKEPTGTETSSYIYAFVDYIEYLAPETSALHLRTDSFMTYHNLIGTVQAFVERRTVTADEDTFGANLLGEPVSYGDYEQADYADYSKTVKISSLNDASSQFYAGVIITPPVITDGDINYDAKLAISEHGGRMIAGSPSGGLVYCVPINEADPFYCLRWFIECVNLLGCDVISVFLIPSECVPAGSPRSVDITRYTGTEGSPMTFPGGLKYMPYNVISHAVYTNADIPDYCPFIMDTRRHKKCYIYPYNYFMLSDESGSEYIIRYEMAENAKLSMYWIPAPNGGLYAELDDYAGAGDDFFSSVPLPPLPYINDGYSQYLGQNVNALAMNKVARVITATESLVPSAYNLTDSILNRAKPNELLKNTWELGTGIVNTLANYQREVATQRDKQATGSTLVNVPTTNMMLHTGDWGITTKQVYLKESELDLLDSFFDRYGYTINKVEQINISHCPDYDYIKTSGMLVTGAIPMADKLNIQNLFDGGITIWHSVERYGLYADSENTNM